MTKQMSKSAKNELIQVLKGRYHISMKKEKSRILDEFIALTKYHRKHAIRLLSERPEFPVDKKPGNRIYNEAVREALIVLWEAGDRICGKRLKAVLPTLLESMERHNHLKLDPEVRQRLLSASAATIDRLLQPIRKEVKVKKRTRRKPKKASTNVQIRTFSDWDDPPPGYLEIDFVEHNGGSSAGSYIRSFGAVDICSAWVECIPLLAKSQELVVEALDVLRQQFPFPLLGIDSDNDSAFINDTVFDYCKFHSIKFTRSRAYRKNDQAWVEQKNGAVIRRFTGHDRYSGIVAGQVLANLFQAVRLYVNYFQPSFKIREKEKDGSKVRRIYEKPMTACERLLNHPAVQIETKKKLKSRCRLLDPIDLLHRIREQQTALAELACRENSIIHGRDSLDQFIKQLGTMWKYGEVRPTHRTPPKKKRYWRTRKDPFETVWQDVLLWLQESPESTAKDLFIRLQNENPGSFQDGQLRTLQRRVRNWRQIMARNLIFANSDVIQETESGPIGIAKRPDFQ